MVEKFVWPPVIPEMGDVIKDYIDKGSPLSIADCSGVYKELETEFARLHGRKYALLVSSGTMALYSAFFGLGLKAGDEVVCTAFSYHATAAPLLHLGVNIKFCDVEVDTGNIDCDKIEELITTKTKAIVTNDQWGHPVDKDKVTALCEKYNLKYVEDCSHAHFSSYKGQYVGTFGDVACWSFQGNKLLSGGEGGILLTDDRDIYERAVLLGHNLKRPKTEVINPAYAGLLRTGFGLKLRMHPLAAVMVLHQLRNYCFDWIESRTKVLDYFQSQLQQKTPLEPMVRRDYVTSMGAWYGFKPRCDFSNVSCSRNDLVNYMQSDGFDVKVPGSATIPSYSLFNDPSVVINRFEKTFDKQSYPGAEAYCNGIISVPTFTFDKDVATVDLYVKAFSSYFNQ